MSGDLSGGGKELGTGDDHGRPAFGVLTFKPSALYGGITIEGSSRSSNHCAEVLFLFSF